MERLSRARPWIDQRSAAEAILGEIYRFRAGARPYDDGDDASVPSKAQRRDTVDVVPYPGPSAPSPSRVLASALKAIEVQSEGRAFQRPGIDASSPVWPPSGACERVLAPDLLVGAVDGTIYDKARVLDQINYHDGNSGKQDRRAMRVAGLIFSLSAATTLALTLSWAWDALNGVAAALAAAIAAAVAWRAFQQRDGIASMSLSTIVLLRHARADWLALPASERSSASGVARYVAEVEDTLASERSEWQRSMRKAQDGYIAQARLNET
jgi:hypothetical protein